MIPSHCTRLLFRGPLKMFSCSSREARQYRRSDLQKKSKSVPTTRDENYFGAQPLGGFFHRARESNSERSPRIVTAENSRPQIFLAALPCSAAPDRPRVRPGSHGSRRLDRADPR
jgi:hypothetical protein